MSTALLAAASLPGVWLSVSQKTSRVRQDTPDFQVFVPAFKNVLKRDTFFFQNKRTWISYENVFVVLYCEFGDVELRHITCPY